MLHDGRHTLKTHTRVEVAMRELRHRAVLLAIVLREDEVPELKETVAIATGAAIRATAADLLALVEVNLGAGTARAGGACRPEVIVLAETADVILGDPEPAPDLEGFIVFGEHGEVQPLDGKLEHLRRKLERPGAGLLLRHASKGEVAEHLEEAGMTAVGTDDVDVVRANALLARRRADLAHGLLALVILLELVHASIREQKRRVIRHERRAGIQLAATLLKEREERGANLSGGHRRKICSHCGISLNISKSQTHKVYMKQAASGCERLACAAKSGHRTHSRLESEGYLRSVE